MRAPDITERLLTAPVDEMRSVAREAREEIIGLRALLNDRICTICAADGHGPAQCPWKNEGKKNA